MKVFYDHQIFTLQDYGGISRYFVELMKLMKHDIDVDFILPNLFSNNQNLKELELEEVKQFISYSRFLKNYKSDKRLIAYKICRKLGFLIDAERKNEENADRKIRNLDFDIFHPTYYSPYFMDVLKKRKIPYVLTVYDLIHELFPNYFLDAKEVIERKKICIENADLILAISQSTKKDLMQIYRIPEERIVVTHLASSFSGSYDKTTESISKELIGKEFILFVGNREIYKNFAFSLESMSPLFRENQVLKLFCIGGGDFNDRELDLIEELGLKNRILYFPLISQSQLFCFYKYAKIFLFPSKYEGFGIPLLEAMHAGCIIACSNTSSFLEVAGDAAFYFDPSDSNSILNNVKKALEDNFQRETLKKKMKEQSLNFSWESTYKETIKGYKKLLPK